MTTAEKIAALKVEDVMKVYSGKANKCMCGCAGKYRVHPLHLAMASKKRGYDYDVKDINLAQVKKVVNILKTHATSAEEFGGGFSVDIAERTFAAYLCPTAC